jgi:hypothetical protein
MPISRGMNRPQCSSAASSLHTNSVERATARHQSLKSSRRRRRLAPPSRRGRIATSCGAAPDHDAVACCRSLVLHRLRASWDVRSSGRDDGSSPRRHAAVGPQATGHGQSKAVGRRCAGCRHQCDPGSPASSPCRVVVLAASRLIHEIPRPHTARLPSPRGRDGRRRRRCCSRPRTIRQPPVSAGSILPVRGRIERAV